MAEEKNPSQGRFARIVRWFRRAGGADSYERYTLALVCKSALAATVSWVVSYDLIDAQSPAFAPFSAVLIMQVTVYQSLVQTLRFVGAVCAGVALQAALGFLFGPTLLTFALVALIAMTIGQWRRLGAQGSQVATAAFFAFSTYVSATGGLERVAQLGQIILLVLIGCGVGVLVNVLVLPPLRYRSAEYGVQALAHSLCDLLDDIHPPLREGELGEDRTSHWRERATYLAPVAAQAQSSVRTASESTYFNPRRRLRRHSHHNAFPVYQGVIDAFERVGHQVVSITRSLDQWQESEDGDEHRDFLRRYGAFLASITEIASLFSTIDEDRLDEKAAELRSATEEAQRQRDGLVEMIEDSALPTADPSHPYGILLAEATRLVDEAQHLRSMLGERETT
ncbi:FUSC family protein [Amycolatopsis sp. CA-230715]|uniref:FUSC family protein n=1 Tax=Amycolatopsis sp. CA-230715 TaxID=2745196 RepID=UPI001C01D831|nr:aromatic acid exporter family protein [Amycolatopsis sp. CA-230715]QWF77797.1 hypothetical protein HUW46_01190 [Amycolatopsis sp. CA-230715]